MRQITRFNYLFVILLLYLAYVPPLNAQKSRIEVPRTHTFPSIENPALPYAQPEEVGLSTEKLYQLGDDIVSWVADGVLIGAELLVVKDGKAVFHEAYGWNDREEERPMRRNSVFWVGSMTKPVTATAALILIEQGRLSLDDRVSEYLPEIHNDSLRVRHLLAHKSGYMYWGDSQEYENELDSHTSLESLLKAYVAHGPVRPFGEYTYSNFNYEALGYIVKKVTGVPAATFTTERVMAPLRLDDTYANFSPDTSSWAGRVNELYQQDPQTREYKKIRWSAGQEMGDPWNFYMPSSGIFSTAMDFARFMSMWLNKGELDGVRLLSEATVEDALRPHTRKSSNRHPYGFGWKVLSSPQHPIVDGMPPAFNHGGVSGTFAVAFPSIDAVVVYMTHSRGNHRTRLKNSLVRFEIFDHPGPYINAGLVPITEVDVLELTPEEQRRYVGTYRSDDPEERQEIVHKVFVEDGRLIVRFWSPGSEEGDQMHLVPIGEHRFGFEGGEYPDRRMEAIQIEWEARFIVEDGRVQGFDVLRGDRVLFSAQRIE